MKIKAFANTMRALPTKHESAFFALMKSFKIECRRQFYVGKYIADFMFPDRCLIVEVDGCGHSGLERRATDIIRDQFLKKCGFKVLRFKNKEILKNPSSVVEAVMAFRSSRKGFNRTHRRLRKLNKTAFLAS
jgi:very-short-patch-repair endonuclease